MSKDLFSKQSGEYSKYRPVYPNELYEFIFSHVRDRYTAWDCGTGNGQAARELAKVFQKVYATDISQKQLDAAVKHPNIEYIKAAAENSGLPESSCDLITVAQAYHWFDFKKFAAEANRVAKPNAIVAVWGYGLMTTDNIEIDRLIRFLYSDVLGSYWDKERSWPDQHYRGIPFYFDDVQDKQFEIKVNWTMSDLLGYLSTWSSLQKYLDANDDNPLKSAEPEFLKAWKGNDEVEFRFPVFLKIGRSRFGSEL
jgi:SAM-dependent methyltransferase